MHFSAMKQQPTTNNYELLKKAFHNKRVWLSGHTGFKGSWLSEWLLDLGAIVNGFALAPDTHPSLFEQLGLADRMEHEIGDVRDAESVRKSIHSFNPDFVFHLAAQPLVRRSYVIPVETFETNVLGTINVLEALRTLPMSGLSGSGVESLKSVATSKPISSISHRPSLHPVVAIIITTDKVYENNDSGRPYVESDPLGGHDPYSSSKAMVEIATAAYKKSYFYNGPICIATARAGNVIGGGDWAEDRIVPDAMRALNQGKTIFVRNPSAVRPWQHVLEPLSGYLTLASRLANTEVIGADILPIKLSTPKLLNSPTSELLSAFNFGPAPDSNRTVEDLVTEILKNRQGSWIDATDPAALHEATLLNLSIQKADQLLSWKPHWNFEETIKRTVAWYDRVHMNAVTPLEITRSQIAEYQGHMF